MTSNILFKGLVAAALALGLQGCVAATVVGAGAKVVGTGVGVTTGAVSMVGDAAFDHDGDGK